MEDIAQECNEVDRVNDECEKMEDNMDCHNASMQDSIKSVFITFVVLIFVGCFDFGFPNIHDWWTYIHMCVFTIFL